MCIIVHKPGGLVLPDIATIKRCWDANPQGAGFMYIKKPLFGPDKLIVEKGFMSWESFRKRIVKFKNYKEEMCLHFRLASHGSISEENCHPWQIDDDRALVHNGIIRWLGDDHATSDSKRFADILKTFDLQNEDHVRVLEEAIGSYNKVVIMDPYYGTVFLNRNSGVEDNGIWYSNSGYKQTIYPITEYKESSKKVRVNKYGYFNWLGDNGF